MNTRCTGPDRSAPVTNGGRGLITAAILSDDPISGQGVAGYLRTAAGIALAGADRQQAADVLVVVTTTLTAPLLDLMEQAHQASAPVQCAVLVADPPPSRALALAFRFGVVSILPRRGVTRESLAAAVLASGHGSSVMPGDAVRKLADLNRDFQDIAYTRHGITGGGLTVRETEVIRLLAEGMSTQEIAARLSYAERTIKNIIRDMLARHQLRNRAQAVAYAYRTGAI